MPAVYIIAASSDSGRATTHCRDEGDAGESFRAVAKASDRAESRGGLCIGVRMAGSAHLVQLSVRSNAGEAAGGLAPKSKAARRLSPRSAMSIPLKGKWPRSSPVRAQRLRRCRHWLWNTHWRWYRVRDGVQGAVDLGAGW